MPQERQPAIQKKGKPFAVSPGLINFVLLMYSHLTQEQRYAIYLGLQKGESKKLIALTIGVHPSTISREIRRNSTRTGKYVWTKAHEKAGARIGRKPGNHSKSEALRWRIRQYILEEQWSPKQISGYLKREEGICVSHETIYRMIRSDEKLAEHCRHKMKYRKRQTSRRITKATNIKNRVSIHDRPKEADGTRFGDWEMDLIVDIHGHAILTLTERSTNFLLMGRLRHGKKAMETAKTVRRLLLPYKGKYLRTITTDNGSEFASHEWISRQLGVPIYFTDAYSSWQKGAVENANKLIRQYIPKGMDISKVSDRRIMSIQTKINSRPREKLKFSTPKREFFKFYL